MAWILEPTFQARLDRYFVVQGGGIVLIRKVVSGGGLLRIAASSSGSAGTVCIGHTVLGRLSRTLANRSRATLSLSCCAVCGAEGGLNGSGTADCGGGDAASGFGV